MLTEQATADLEKWRTKSFRTRNEHEVLTRTLADELARLYPPGWDADISEERLLACGFIDVEQSYWLQNGKLLWWRYSPHGFRYCGETITYPFEPENMLEVWQLLDKCGLPSPLSPKSEEATPQQP